MLQRQATFYWTKEYHNQDDGNQQRSLSSLLNAAISTMISEHKP